MIEDELRTLLRSRAAAPPDNPARIAEVRSRIVTTRRRRAVGGAFGLVLLALASLLAIRLPGSSESLPPGVPAPPYFTAPGRPDVPGYVKVGTDVGPQGFEHVANPSEYFRYLFVVRCGEPEDVTVRRAVGGEPYVVECRTKVGDHHEGALPVTPGQAHELFEMTTEAVNVRVEHGSPGVPDLHLLEARAPERLPDGDTGGYLVDGRLTPGGSTVDLAVPEPQSDVPVGSEAGFGLLVECVAGVRLTFRVPAAELGSVTCDPRTDAQDPSTGLIRGAIAFHVSGTDMRRLGLAYGRRVRLTVERSGTVTDQWRVSAVG